MNRPATLLALAALAAANLHLPAGGPADYDRPPRQPARRAPTEADLSRLEAAAAKRSRRAARRLQRGSSSAEFLVFAVIVVVVLLGAYAAFAHSCSERWADSGLRSEFRFSAGCMVQKDGRWLPESALREVGL